MFEQHSTPSEREYVSGGDSATRALSVTVVESAFQSVRAGHDQMSQLKHGMETSA